MTTNDSLQPKPEPEPQTKPWWIFTGDGVPDAARIKRLPKPPAWRNFGGSAQNTEWIELDRTPDPEIQRRLGIQPGTIQSGFRTDEKMLDMVNAALYLRRPLLVTGKSGTGKSTLAHAIAYELGLGAVLVWAITSRSTLQSATYTYDAVGRLQAASQAEAEQKLKAAARGLFAAKDVAAPPGMGEFIRLGPVGTAFLPTAQPRVLLIDEIDKSDIDLPNDLLNLFEEGWYEIPELTRLPKDQQTVSVLEHDGKTRVPIQNGRVTCAAFPIVIITSNGERELPAPLQRRCLRLDIEPPNAKKLKDIVRARFGEAEAVQFDALINEFFQRREQGSGHLANDQLMNAIYLAAQPGVPFETLKDEVLKKLT